MAIGLVIAMTVVITLMANVHQLLLITLCINHLEFPLLFESTSTGDLTFGDKEGLGTL